MPDADQDLALAKSSPKGRKAVHTKFWHLAEFKASKFIAACQKYLLRANFMKTDEQFLCRPAGISVLFNKNVKNYELVKLS